MNTPNRPASAPPARPPVPWHWWALILLVILLDQLTKLAVVRTLVPMEAISLTPFFKLVHVYNTGAAFSFLAQHPAFARIFFILLALLVSGWLLHMLCQHARERPREHLLPAALSLIIGGALGNVIDRFTHGAVVDFLFFHYQDHGFPAFNLADSAITLGVILMLASQLRTPPSETPAP